MTKAEVLDKVKELAAAPNVFTELKLKAEAYLADEANKEKAKALIEELSEDVQTNENVIAIFSAEAGKKMVGEEMAKTIADHAKENLAKGNKYCDCPACSPGKVILDNRALIL